MRRLSWLLAVVTAAGSGVLVAGAAAADPTDPPPSIVDDLSYPGAEQILAEQNVRLIAGDGHIRLVDCATPVSGDIGLLKVFTTDETIGADGVGRVCFRVLAPTGLLALEVPGVYEIRGDGLRTGTGHEVTADLRSDDGEEVTVDVDPDGSTQVGMGADPHAPPTTLLKLTVAESGPSGELSSHPFVARVLAGDRGCAGVLVAPRWVATAKSCFGTGEIGAGAPPQAAYAVVGRADLTTGGGHASDVVELVPRADRDLVLARLASPATGIAPIALADTVPAVGASVQAAGYGRGIDGWPGDRLGVGAFTVAATTANAVDLSRAAGTATSVCEGDAGGPAFGEVDGQARLIGVHSRSWQTGCAGVTETRDATVVTRTDDIVGWIGDQTLDACQAPVEDGFTALYNGGSAPASQWSVVGEGKTAEADCELRLTDGAALLQYTGRRMPAAYTLRLDFKATAADADGGIVVGLPRATDAAGTRGVEVQLKPTGTGDAATGAILGLNPPTASAERPHGAWNTLQVTVASRRLTVRINGTPVNDYTVADPARLLASGFVALRADPAHPQVRFRSIRMRADEPGVEPGTVPVLYGYNGSLTRMWLFQGVGGPPAATTRAAWDSGTGNWDWNRTRPVAGDFDGDGKQDAAAFYNYDNGHTRLFLFRNVTGSGVVPVQVWDSGRGGWDWHRMKAVAGDFDGDGKAEIGAFYNYGGGQTKLWVFDRVDAATTTPMVWDSGPGSWDWNRIRPVAGDFDGDGKAEIGAFYNYDNSLTRLFVFRNVGGPSAVVSQAWDSGPGNWNGNQATPVPGDFDGDGRADIAAYYNYGNRHTKLWRFTNVATAATGALAWDGGPNNWDANRAKPVVGDFDGDGRTDIAAYYDYGNSQIRLWRFTNVGGAAAGALAWDSGPGSWDWARVMTIP
jgi:hypothetical protein